MKKEILLGLSVLCAAFPGARNAYAGIGDWKNYTYMNNAVGLVSSRNAEWVGTTGGVLRFTIGDSAFQKFTNSEGLTGNDVSAIGLDQQGSVWIGEKSGSIDIYSPASNTWRYLDDIAVSLQSQKGINAFFMHGDSVYIATAFGVSVFSLAKFEFHDTYGIFGTLSHPNVTSLTILNGRVFVGTSGGTAVSRVGATNLAAPESWDSYAVPASVTGMAAFQGSVYAASSSGAYVYQGGAWVQVPGAGQPLVGLVSTDSALYMAGLNSLLVLSPANTVSAIGGFTPAAVTCAAIDSTGRIFIGCQDGGISTLNGARTQWNQYLTNGPTTNFFPSIVVDEDGVVWAASAGPGGHATGRGFYSFDGKKWRDYTVATTPQLQTNEFFSVSLGPNNSKWLGSWGRGVVLVDGNGNVVRTFDDTYPGFPGADKPTSVVIGKIAADASGNVWVPMFTYLSRQALWEMKTDSTWKFVNSASSNSYGLFLGVTIDRNGTKWCSNTLPDFAPKGDFMYYNESVSVQGLAGDDWGELAASSGLTSETVTSVVEDQNGNLWVGTDVGITIVNDPALPLSQNTLVFLGAVRDQFINTIVVDPLNNKWIGTQTGVDYVSADGSALLGQYTTQNTNGKLVDNNVLSIALDQKKGIAYFGTGKGLSSLEIPAIATIEKMSSLEIGPNPYIVPSENSFTIKGLADNATIKILNVRGSLVKEFAAQGAGRAFWDGTDGNGKIVGSGIYFVVAYADNGNQVSTAKLAVIRR